MKIPNSMTSGEFLRLRDFVALAMDSHGIPGPTERAQAERLIQFGLVDIGEAERQMSLPPRRGSTLPFEGA